MDILKHGKFEKEEDSAVETFKCHYCGCEFSAKTDEYYIDKASEFDVDKYGITSGTSYVYSTMVMDTYVCSCPECHKIVKRSVERTIVNPAKITYSSTTIPIENVPENCRNCSNHPSNGGSGICNCILGGTEVTC